MRHKQCLRHAVHEVLKSKTCLFTYNAKSNLLFMQVIFLTQTEICYQNRLIQLAVVIDPGSVYLGNASDSRQSTHQWTVEVPN